MILLTIPMKNRRHESQSLSALARAVTRLPRPRDYYNGRRCPHLDLPDNLLLFCRHSATELHDGSLQPHFHHRWILALPLRGRATVQVDERQFPLQPGTALLVPPLRLHQYRNVSRGKIDWLFVTFELPDRDAQAVKPEPGRLSPNARAYLGEIIRLWQHGDSTAETRARLAVHTALLLLALRRESAAPAASPPALLDRVNRWITAHQREPFVLANLAVGIGLSGSYLRALFRQQFGLSLGRYVCETRCRLAALRLREGGLTVTEIAAACGFSSVYSFSRTFKRVIGVPPSVLLELP
jgi:AraC-like DNA-binding protein/mannose-6-phosphate isomerase-like protein (cupin superfamily)